MRRPATDGRSIADGSVGSRLGAFAFLARRRGKQQIAPRLDGGRGLDGLRRRRRVLRPRSRAAASSCHGGGMPAAHGSAWPASSSAGWSRPNRKPLVFRRLIARRAAAGCGAVRRPRCCGNAGAKPPRNILQLPNHHPKAEHDHPGAGRDRTREDQGIAETEFLDRNSETDRQEASQQQADPGNQQRNHHRIHPPAALEMRASRHRHDTVILCASPTGNCGWQFPRRPVGQHPGHSDPDDYPASDPSIPAAAQDFYLAADCCIASGKLRHNCQLLGTGTALYGCRGTRPKSAKAGPQGTPGYQ